MSRQAYRDIGAPQFVDLCAMCVCGGGGGGGGCSKKALKSIGLGALLTTLKRARVTHSSPTQQARGVRTPAAAPHSSMQRRFVIFLSEVNKI